MLAEPMTGVAAVTLAGDTLRALVLPFPAATVYVTPDATEAVTALLGRLCQVLCVKVFWG